MDILRDIISSFEQDFPVRDIRTGCYWTAVASRVCGLASTFITSCPHHAQGPVRDAGNLLALSARTLAGYVFSSNLLEATIGMAAINSLIAVDQSCCSEENAYIELSRLSAERNTVVVGDFPFNEKLKRSALSLTVITRAKGETILLDDKEIEALCSADLVAITGTTLINHTLDEILLTVNKKALKMMLGPTTPLSPILFDYGFDFLSGIAVEDEDKVLRYLSQGATFREMEGIKLLARKKK
jgi:uncharacterized protein